MYSFWRGRKVTEELKKLYKQYDELFRGYPDEYLELEGCYDDMSYEEYVGYIKECIEKKKAMPYVVYPDENPDEWDY